MKARFIIAVAASLLLSNMSQASEIRLLASVAMKDAYLELIPQFVKDTTERVATPCNLGVIGPKRRFRKRYRSFGQRFSLPVLSAFPQVRRGPVQ